MLPTTKSPWLGKYIDMEHTWALAKMSLTAPQGEGNLANSTVQCTGLGFVVKTPNRVVKARKTWIDEVKNRNDFSLLFDDLKQKQARTKQSKHALTIRSWANAIFS